MTLDLDDRLRQHYDRRTADLPSRGPGLDASQTIVVAGADTSSPSWLRMAIIGTAAAAVIAGLVVVAGVRSGDDAPAASQSPAPAALEPVAALPDSPDLGDDVPATIVANEPVAWYRLAPDLAVSWYQPQGGVSMLCWRTPIGQDCVEDTGADVFPLVVPTAGDQTLVVTTGNSDVEADQLDVVLDDGTVLSAPIGRDEQISWGISRFEVPAGRSIATMQELSLGGATRTAADPSDVSGATLPPSADLNEVPITIATGQPLSYWRWFADLDISERQTPTGGTELCWRTPAGTGCIDDDFSSPDVGRIPTDGATIVLARPGLVPIVPTPSDPNAPKFWVGPNPKRVVATLSDGTTVTVELTYGDEFGVGWARIPTPEGVEMTDARSEE
jgi:hypothetical protein